MSGDGVGDKVKKLAEELVSVAIEEIHTVNGKVPERPKWKNTGYVVLVAAYDEDTILEKHEGDTADGWWGVLRTNPKLTIAPVSMEFVAGILEGMDRETFKAVIVPAMRKFALEDQMGKGSRPNVGG
jgi:hypothetical protein